MKPSDETKQPQLHRDWMKTRIKESFLFKNKKILLGLPVIL